jgi:hypothetical protein
MCFSTEFLYDPRARLQTFVLSIARDQLKNLFAESDEMLRIWDMPTAEPEGVHGPGTMPVAVKREEEDDDVEDAEDEDGINTDPDPYRNFTDIVVEAGEEEQMDGDDDEVEVEVHSESEDEAKVRPPPPKMSKRKREQIAMAKAKVLRNPDDYVRGEYGTRATKKAKRGA